MSTPPTPPTEPTEPTERLMCGAPVDAIFDQVSAGNAGDYTAHQSGCPHCQAALAEYDRLWAPLREAAATRLRAPDNLLDDAIARIRAAIDDPAYATVPGPTGTTRIAARVVVITARETAQHIAGVRVALSKLLDPVSNDPAGETNTGRDPEPAAAPGALAELPGRVRVESQRPAEAPPRVVAGVAGRSTAVEITLAADYGVDLQVLGATIKTQVTRRIREITGLDPVAVSVRIDDVFP